MRRRGTQRPQFKGSAPSPGGPAFAPSDIANLALWLDGADTDTITLDGSDNVEEWLDKSANARVFGQATVLNRPGYSADGLAFTSAAMQLTNATSVDNDSPVTMFVALRATEVASYGSIGGVDTFFRYGGWSALTTSSGVWGRFTAQKEAVATNAFTTINQIATTDRIFRIAAKAGGVDGKVIGATTQTQTVAAMAAGSGSTGLVGTFPRGNMVIREILFYNAELTAGEITNVETYLAGKWA